MTAPRVGSRYRSTGRERCLSGAGLNVNRPEGTVWDVLATHGATVWLVNSDEAGGYATAQIMLTDLEMDFEPIAEARA